MAFARGELAGRTVKTMAKEWIVPDADLGCDGAYFDYQELVRCRECAHNLRPGKPNSVCGLDIPIFDIYGYCSEGERREGGEQDAL